MSRPPKLDPDQKARVSSRLQMRLALLTQLKDYALKHIASVEGVEYGVVWRLNAAINGKRNYKRRVAVEMRESVSED